MKNLKSLSTLLFLALLVIGCNEVTDDSKNTDQNGVTEENSIDTSDQNEAETPQTVEERIAEIKKWYAQIQKLPKQAKNCVSKSKTTIDKNLIEEGIPFENTAKKCSLEEGLSYEQVELNGYEWSETASFYFNDDQLFFTFVTGGAEAYGYEYRVYYDNKGEIIRVLLSENDYDGDAVGSPKEVKDAERKKEILTSVDYARKELKSILGEK